MIDSRIHRNMKIAQGGGVPTTRLLWSSTQHIITAMTEDRRYELGSQFLWHRDLYKFLTVMRVWFIFLMFCFVFGHETTYTIRVFAVFRLNYSMYWNDNLTERNKNLKNLESSFSFLFGDICLVAHRNVVNYGTWHVFKPFFGSSVVTCPPACSTIWL